MPGCGRGVAGRGQTGGDPILARSLSTGGSRRGVTAPCAPQQVNAWCFRYKRGGPVGSRRNGWPACAGDKANSAPAVGASVSGSKAKCQEGSLGTACRGAKSRGARSFMHGQVSSCESLAASSASWQRAQVMAASAGAAARNPCQPQQQSGAARKAQSRKANQRGVIFGLEAFAGGIFDFFSAWPAILAWQAEARKLSPAD